MSLIGQAWEHCRCCAPETLSSQMAKGLYQWTAVGHQTGPWSPVRRQTLGRVRGIKSNCIIPLGGLFGVAPFDSFGALQTCFWSPAFWLSSALWLFLTLASVLPPVSLSSTWPALSLYPCLSHLHPPLSASDTAHYHDPHCDPAQAPALLPDPPLLMRTPPEELCPGQQQCSQPHLGTSRALPDLQWQCPLFSLSSLSLSLLFFFLLLCLL